MDLGRVVCRPVPRCAECFIARWCVWSRAAPPPAAAGRGGRQGPSEGSFRQVRGGVIRRLRRGPATPAELSRAVGRARADVTRAVDALLSEGAVERRPGGRLRLAET